MPVKKLLQDKVIQHVLQEIQLLKLMPGDIISEVGLAHELGISRTPVREALIRLVSDGVLNKVPQKGYTLVHTDRALVDNTHEAIGVLDGYAAVLALPRMGMGETTKMREIADKIDIALRYHNFSDYYALQSDFHNVYVERCGNDVIISLLKSLKGGAVRQTYSTQDNDRLFEVLSESHTQHREIISLIEKGDATQLEHYLRNVHWHTVHPDLIIA